MKYVYALLFLILLSSCGNNLSRSEAEDLINKHNKFTVLGQKPRTNSQAKYNGTQQGYWQKNGTITQKGKTYFYNKNYNNITLKRPGKAVVTTIDGIADAGNNSKTKEVQFSWEYANIDEVVKRFIIKGGTGKAFLRKFDDGWRVNNISFSYKNESFPLTAANKANIKNDIEIEKQRQIEEQKRREAALAKRKAEEEKRNLLIAASKKVNKTLGTFNGIHGFTGRKLKEKITLTDVHIYRNLPGTENNLNIWLGAITQRPTAHRFNQTAMGWNGFAIKVNNKNIKFKEQNEATRFYNMLNTAIDNWNKKYPELKKI
ncbi:MAG: hypothetical protein AB8B65_13375 [Kordia sp.]|uniref:hypothetical protein n=1 Tax=Kordia sp. TaxID=1965332 RepID=UPI00385C3264